MEVSDGIAERKSIDRGSRRRPHPTREAIVAADAASPMRAHSIPVKMHAMIDERIDRRTAFGRLGVGAVLLASNRPTAATTSLVAPLPDRFRRVVLRLDPDPVDLEASLRYEGNNLDLRGPRGPEGLQVDSGEMAARRWRLAAAGCAGLFVLRDSLWSQQDHPTRQHAFAPYLPPAWITAACLVARGDLAWRPIFDAPIDDDSAWAGCTTPALLFGNAPISERLHSSARSLLRETQTADPARSVMATNARRTFRELGAAMRRMHAVSVDGPDMVATIGAEIACRTDRRYFTPELRRRRFIPITVTNPTTKEIGEGKGPVAPDHASIPGVAALGSMVMRTLLRRRLADGDIAVERYDLSQPESRAAAIDLLRNLVPKDGAVRDGGRVWLWVNGPLDPQRKMRGADAGEWIPTFRRELDRSDIDHRRVRLFNKPSFDLPSGPGRAAALDAGLARATRLDVPLSLNLRTTAFRRILR